MLAEGAMARTAIIFCAGGPARAPLPEIRGDALVIAADSGVTEAERLGFHVDLLVGDLDSADPEAVGRVEAAGGTIERHPTDKDASDLELAMGAAVAADVRRIVVVGGDGGRFDHLLGNALLLASPRFADVDIEAVLGGARIVVVRGDRDVSGTPGALVTLFALGGSARVTTEGLRWSLDHEELLPGSTRGLSNEFVTTSAHIHVYDGVALAIVQGAEGS
jgi:thiamine pyrophosphokinase